MTLIGMWFKPTMEANQSVFLLSLFVTVMNSSEMCAKFKTKYNVNYDPNSCQLVNLQSPMDCYEYVKICNKNSAVSIDHFNFLLSLLFHFLIILLETFPF